MTTATNETTATETVTWTTVNADRDVRGASIHVARIDFGFTDARGRAVGCKVQVDEVPFQPAVTGPWCPRPAIPAHIESTVHSTRNGKTFGALPPRKRHPAGTALEQAKADVLKRAADSAKRQRRAHAGDK